MERIAKHGIVSVRELRAMGVPDSTVRSRVQAGRWYRIYRGVISVVHPSMLRPEGRWLAAVRACGEGAALAAREAARLHGLRSRRRSRIDVIVPRHRHPKLGGIDVHRSCTLRASDITEVNGIPVTTVSRTIFDCAGLLTRDELERLIGEAEIQEVLDNRALRELIALNRNTVAAKRLAELLDSYEYDRGVVLNDFEQDLRNALRDAGAPPPLKNRWIVLSDGGPPVQPDFQWPDARLALNADGFKFHRSRVKFERDTTNDQRMIDDEWLPMHVTYRQARNPRERARVIATVLRQLRKRSRAQDG
jgi:predicted transcriptional regulator of viral defense system